MLNARLSFTIIACTVVFAAPALAQKKVVAYVPNWISLKKFADEIDYAKLTHINVAFENPIDALGTLSFHSQTPALITKAHASGVKVLVSLGGGSASEAVEMRTRYFGLIDTPEHRAAFAKRISDFVLEHHFDGVDVDLEGPAINEHYGPFIDELAKLLKPMGKLLTSAVSKGYGGKAIPDATLAQFDFVNIMAYDATGPWMPKAAGQHASFAFAQGNVEYWLARGLPKSKAVLGVPFYGYGFGTAFRASSYSYAEIIAANPGGEKVDQIGSTIWYNGIPTIEAKARYVAEQDLAGVMIWSLDNDAKGEQSLLSAIGKILPH